MYMYYLFLILSTMTIQGPQWWFNFSAELKAAQQQNSLANTDEFKASVKQELKESADKFWKNSPQYIALQRRIIDYTKTYKTIQGDMSTELDAIHNDVINNIATEVEKLKNNPKLRQSYYRDGWNLKTLARKVNLKSSIDQHIWDVKVEFHDLSPKERKEIESKKFSITSLESWKETSLLLWEEFGNSIKDIALFFASIPWSILAIPEYIYLRRNRYKSLKNEATLSLMLEEFPGLALVDLFTDWKKWLRTLKMIGSKIISGTQWDIAFIIVGLLGLLAGWATAVSKAWWLAARIARIGSAAARKSANAWSKMAQAAQALANATARGASRVSKASSKVAATAGAADAVASGEIVLSAAAKGVAKGVAKVASMWDGTLLRIPRWLQWKVLSNEYARIIEHNSWLNDANRLSESAKVLELTDLSSQQKAAIQKAHETGTSGAGRWTQAELRQKYNILINEWGFTKKQARTLMEHGLTGAGVKGWAYRAGKWVGTVARKVKGSLSKTPTPEKQILGWWQKRPNLKNNSIKKIPYTDKSIEFDNLYSDYIHQRNNLANEINSISPTGYIERNWQRIFKNPKWQVTIYPYKQRTPDMKYYDSAESAADFIFGEMNLKPWKQVEELRSIKDSIINGKHWDIVTLMDGTVWRRTNLRDTWSQVDPNAPALSNNIDVNKKSADILKEVVDAETKIMEQTLIDSSVKSRIDNMVGVSKAPWMRRSDIIWGSIRNEIGDLMWLDDAAFKKRYDDFRAGKKSGRPHESIMYDEVKKVRESITNHPDANNLIAYIKKNLEDTSLLPKDKTRRIMHKTAFRAKLKSLVENKVSAAGLTPIPATLAQKSKWLSKNWKSIVGTGIVMYILYEAYNGRLKDNPNAKIAPPTDSDVATLEAATGHVNNTDNKGNDDKPKWSPQEDETSKSIDHFEGLSDIDFGRESKANKNIILTQKRREDISRRYTKKQEWKDLIQKWRENEKDFPEIRTIMNSIVKGPTVRYVQILQKKIGMLAQDDRENQDGILGKRTLAAIEAYMDENKPTEA